MVLYKDTQEKITDLALKKTSLKQLPEGSVLVAMYGGFNQIGRTELLTQKAAINQALSALLPHFRCGLPILFVKLFEFSY